MNQLSNKLFGLISMYHGMLLGLIGIWLVALLLSFFGGISYSPLEMIASLAVLFFTVGLVSWFCSWLFKVEIYGLSSMITAFILALIFSPTLEVGGLVVLALVGILAAASKFLLVYRGRHIFNPAAIAAVVIGLTGLGAASWWVATPPLALIVFAAAAVAVYKSRRFGMVALFFATAIPLLLIVFLFNGVSVIDGLPLLLSWPLLFIGGVMLIEPLTLPPLRWQMYVEAVIVGILVALPLSFGSFEMNPALALVIGNIFAAVVAERQAIALTFKERRSLTPTTDELVFTPSVPVPFIPGQFMEITLLHDKMDLRGGRRSFSLTSLPLAKEVTFGVKYYERSSSFKKSLKVLKPGTVVKTANLSGDFVLPKDVTQPLLFVAGGIGITPFISQLKSVSKKGEQRDITLIYTMSDASELAYRSVLIQSGVRVVIVSPNKPSNFPKEWKYAKGSRLTEELTAKIIGKHSYDEAYISGPTPFVQTAKRFLRRSTRSVHTDFFVGY